MRLGLVLLVSALVAPCALAQVPMVTPQLAVFAADPGRAFFPGAVEPVEVTITYGPGQGGRPAPAPSAEEPEDTRPTRITLSATALPSWVEGATFEPPEVFVDMGVENGTRPTYSRMVTALLQVSPEAPALEREPLVVMVTAEPNGNIQGATAESPPLNLRVTTVGLLNVSGPEQVVIPGGRWSTVEFTVRNDGNSAIVAKVNVTVRPENSQVEFAETLELARDGSAVVPVRVRTPWTAAEFGTLELEATPIVEGELGTPARAEVAVVGESAVPTPGVLPLAGLLAALAVLRRR